MESATLHRAPPLSGQVQAGLVALLLLAAAGAWALTDRQMAGMDAGPGSELGGLAWFVGIWVVMMAAMMLPSISPVVIAYAGAGAGTGRVRAAAATAAFVAGYLVAWTAAGLAAFLLIEGVRSLDFGFFAWDAAGPYLAGGVIVAAALYQLSAAKDACLENCRDPQRFLPEPGRTGPVPALSAGIAHAGFCVGCCWALMAVLFALGVMSIAWMAFVAALIAAEKLLPSPAAARHGVAVLLAAVGIAVAAAPEQVPGLTIPGSAEAMGGMESMEPKGMNNHMEED